MSTGTDVPVEIDLNVSEGGFANETTITITATPAAGSSISDDDYTIALKTGSPGMITNTGSPYTLTIPANEPTITLEFTANDTDSEEETLTLTLTSTPTSNVGTQEMHTIMIEEVATPSIEFATLSSTARDLSTGTDVPVEIDLNVSEGGFANETTITITATPAAGSSISDDDYTIALKTGSPGMITNTGSPYTLTIPANEPTITLEFTANDTDSEEETLTLTLTSTPTSNVGTQEMHTIMIEEVATPSIEFATLSSTARDLSTGTDVPVEIDLNVSEGGFANETTITITATPAAGSSISDDDYTIALKTGSPGMITNTGSPYTLTIPANEPTITLEFTANDTDSEEETLTLTLTSTPTSNVGTQEMHTIMIRELVDYDTDDDGLIEIHTLDQLNALRYDLDGDGMVEATDEASYGVAFPIVAGGSTYGVVSCGDGVTITSCSGYELMADLDFNDIDGAGTKSIWAKDCVTGCVTGMQADGTNGNIGWEPIGNTASFGATFDGNDRTISGLYINRMSSTGIYVGLFGNISSATTLDSLGLVDVEVTIEAPSGTSYVGGLAGRSDGTITSCYTTGDVTSETATSATAIATYTGGLVGYIDDGSIATCYTTGDVTSIATTAYAGGLVGGIRSSAISACYTTGDVTSEASTTSYAGGLVGHIDDSNVTACYATGNVEVESESASSYAGGGLIGHMSGSSIAGCYASGGVTTISPEETSFAGGLIGNNDNGTIIESYYTTEAMITNNGASTMNTLGDAYPIATLIAAIAYDFDHDSDPSTDALYPAANWNVDVDNADNDSDLTTNTDDPWDFGDAMEWPVLRSIDANRDGMIDAADLEAQRNPGTGDPGTGDPGTGDPGTGDPGTGDPGTGGTDVFFATTKVSSRVIVYPNPTSGKVMLSLPSEKSCEVSVIALNGRLVLQDHLRDGSIHMLDVSELKDGLYFLEITFSDGHRVRHRILKAE